MTLSLTPSDDLGPILDAAQSMLDAQYPVARCHAGHPDDLTALRDFGALTLALPETRGGAGLSVVEEARLHVALGRHLLSPAALAAPVALRIAHDAGDQTLADRIATGTHVTCALPDGQKLVLLDSNNAELGLIRDKHGLHLRPLGPARDQTTALGHSLPATRHDAAATPGLTATTPTQMLFDLLCAAQLLGVAQGAMTLAVTYAQTREQFGRPIGGFQAIKHHCANMALGVEMLDAQLDFAAITLRDDLPDADFQIAALTRLAPRTALSVARSGIQIGGGMGFSGEGDAHLYLKQAHVPGALIGRPDLLSLTAPMAPHGKAPA